MQHSESCIDFHSDLLITLMAFDFMTFFFPFWTKLHLLFQKHINSLFSKAWRPKYSEHPHPMCVFWLFVQVLNVSHPIFSIHHCQIVLLKRALIISSLPIVTQRFHMVSSIRYRFLNKILKTFQTLALDQYVGLIRL